MLVSIIIPNRNKGAFIGAALESLRAQTSRDWEAIIVDDASTDDSLAIAERFAAEDSRFRVIRTRDLHDAGAARNIGAAAAKGEAFAFFDSDDIVTPDYVERRAAALCAPENADCDLLVFPLAAFKESINETPLRIYSRNLFNEPAEKVICRGLSHDGNWTTMMPIWRRAAFEKVGGFPEGWLTAEDTGLQMRALLAGCRFRVYPDWKPDYFMRVSDARRIDDFSATARRVATGYRRYICEFAPRVAENRARRAALRVMAITAVRDISQFCRAGKISRELWKEETDSIISASRDCGLLAPRHVAYLRAYRFAFLRLRLCAIKGFNFLSAKILRALP